MAFEIEQVALCQNLTKEKSSGVPIGRERWESVQPFLNRFLSISTKNAVFTLEFAKAVNVDI